MRNFNKLEMVRTSQIDTGLALKLGPGLIWGDVLEFAPPTRYSFPHGQSVKMHFIYYIFIYTLYILYMKENSNPPKNH